MRVEGETDCAVPGEGEWERSLSPSSISDLERVEGTKLGETCRLMLVADEREVALEDGAGSSAGDELCWGSTGAVARGTVVFVDESMVEIDQVKLHATGEG
jgi:hypothetical protein